MGALIPILPREIIYIAMIITCQMCITFQIQLISWRPSHAANGEDNSLVFLYLIWETA